VAKLNLKLLPTRVTICRLASSSIIPDWAVTGAGFCSVTRTGQELSIVCSEDNVPAIARQDRGWRVFEIEGPFEFSAIGVLASVAVPLAEAAVPIFAISTFDTDYVLVKEPDVERAAMTLKSAGHQVTL
jgi:hypothetical protein